MKIMLAMMLTVSAQAFAAPNEANDKVSKEEIQSAYDTICTPGSKNYAAKESKDFRIFMQELLIYPTPTLSKLKADDSFGGVLALGISCGLVTIMKGTLMEKGCTLENGDKVNATEAINQCEVVINDLRKAQEAEEVEPQEP